YVAPAYLLIVLGGFIYFNGRAEAAGLRGNPVALWTVGVIGLVILLLVVMVAIGERRWKAMELALDTPDRTGEGTRS
ncbi:MAG: hypothetical protein ABIR29_02685, partial [Chthoniobacterales bacterium]